MAKPFDLGLGALSQGARQPVTSSQIKAALSAHFPAPKPKATIDRKGRRVSFPRINANEVKWRGALSSQGNLSAPTDSDWRGDLAHKASNAADFVGLDGRKAYNAAEHLLSAADYIPGVGDAATGADAIQAGRNGNYLEAGALSLATALGMVPGVGDAASKALQMGAKGLRRAAAAEDLLPSSIKGLDLDAMIPAKAPEAPAIIQSRPIPEADWGYDPKYTNLKNRPAAEVGFEQTHQMLDRNIISPEDLFGKRIIAGMTDRSRAGGVLSSINGKSFDPIEMQGGQDFMRQQGAAKTGAVWGSDSAPVSSFLNAANKHEEEAIFAPYTMSGSGSDYSTMMSDAVLGQLQGTTKKARKAFDKAMRDVDPSWLGMENLDNLPALRAQLKDRGGLRTLMAKKLDNGGVLKTGMPDAGATREAVTDPRWATVPSETFGGNMGALSGKRVENQAIPHDTYADQMEGKYVGSMDVPIPTNLMLPDFFNGAMNNGARRQDIGYLMTRGVKTQKADQQWLDNIMPWYEREVARGSNWSSPVLRSKPD